MSYVVLARKWRPQTFDDLVGQEHVSRTLANAIASDRVAHAFLFTGVRGVGKTTSARILAKALNCEKGASASPCLTCNACREIGIGSDIDVQEIDGASYTGVDAVRSLQETIPYRPARDRYKIYIVDEVHMLSTAAWNAFLKTLEEPPPHVKFIFATTEVVKVPNTILSRCQRFDFKLISTNEIAARLRHVLEQEKVAADDEAVRIVAREAAGSMRDAMSLLDQVIAWVGGSGEKLTADGVARVLGVAARSVLHQLASALVDGDASRCLHIVGELAEQGFQLANVARDFLEQLRMLVVAKVSDAPEKLLSLADEELADVKALADRSQADDLSRLYLAFSRAFDDIARSAQPRGALEMALVRLARRPPLLPLDDLLRRLAALEQRLEGGAGGAGGAGRPSGGPKPGGGATPGSGVRPGGGADAGSQRTASRDDERARSMSAPSPPAPSPPAPSPPAPSPPAPSPPAHLSVSAPSDPGAAMAVASATPEVQPAAARAARTLEPSAQRDWEQVLANLRERKPAIASIFEHAAPLHVSAERIELGYQQGSFLAEQAASPDTRALLAAVLEEHFGAVVAIAFDLSGRHREVQTVAARNSAAQAARLEAARQRVADHPLVAAAVRVLGAELREVRLPTEAG